MSFQEKKIKNLLSRIELKIYCLTYSSPETKLERKHNEVCLREAWEGKFDGAYNTERLPF